MMFLHMPRAKKITMALIACIGNYCRVVLLLRDVHPERRIKIQALPKEIYLTISTALRSSTTLLIYHSGVMRQETADTRQQAGARIHCKIFDSLKNDKARRFLFATSSLQYLPGLQGVNVIGVIKGYQYENSYIAINCPLRSPRHTKWRNLLRNRR